MSKIAVIVYGQYRDFEIAQKSWGFLNDLGCDFYFSTWSRTCNVHWHENVEYRTVTKDMILKFYPNAQVSILDEETYQIILSEMFNIPNYAQKKSEKMIFHWKNGLKMIKDSRKPYSQLILTRFDNFFSTTLTPQDFYKLIEDNKIYNNTRGLFLNERNTYTIDDLFFISKFNFLQNFIESLGSSIGPVNIHDYLAKKIIDLGYDAHQLCENHTDFDVCVVRPNVKELKEEEININTVNKKYLTY